MINYIADKIYNHKYQKGLITFRRNTEEWSNWDYNLRCNLFNYGTLTIMLLLNILFSSWREFFIIVLVFNILRNFTDGIHAKVLSYCTLFSTVYFTILSIIAHKIICSNNMAIYYSLPFLGAIGSIYVYRYIPKANINEDNELKSENNEEELTIDEKKQAYRYCIIGLSIIIIVSLFLLHLKLIPISLSMGLLSLEGILTNTGEKIFNYIQDIYIRLINNK